MKTFLLQFFTWWNGQTLGTRFLTWRRGTAVGQDEFGNLYYRDPRTDRRWVIYAGKAEPSQIPPGWHGWIHRKVDVPPSEAEYQPKAWQKPHMANMTGTALAYHPKGSLLSPEPKKAEGGYEPWTP